MAVGATGQACLLWVRSSKVWGKGTAAWSQRQSKIKAAPVYLQLSLGARLA